MQERIQKFLAHAGVASRRQAEELMRQGRVTVNGTPVTTMGARVDPQTDSVKVDGKRIRPEPLSYILINKPRGTICTLDDPQGRPMVVDLVKGVGVRLYPVGRLDYDTAGALLLTNDGELANQLTHPKHNVPRVYVAKVKGVPNEASLEKLERGVVLDGRRTRPAKVRLRTKKVKNSYLELTLAEGRNKQVKRMCQAVGHPVLRLEREAFGFLTLEGLAPGKWRRLEAPEVSRLKQEASRGLSESGPVAAKLKPKSKSKSKARRAPAKRAPRAKSKAAPRRRKP